MYVIAFLIFPPQKEHSVAPLQALHVLAGATTRMLMAETSELSERTQWESSK